MRWLILLLAGCSDFTETIYVHVDDAPAVTIGDKTYTSDFQINREFPSEDDAERNRIQATAHFPDKDVTVYFGTTCGPIPGPYDLLDAPSYETSMCSFYLVENDLHFDCACTDDKGDTVGYNSDDDQF